MNKLQLTPQQLAFMETFGYLLFPGLLSDRIDRIIEEFENVFIAQGGGHNGRPHDGTARSCILPSAQTVSAMRTWAASGALVA